MNGRESDSIEFAQRADINSCLCTLRTVRYLTMWSNTFQTCHYSAVILMRPTYNQVPSCFDSVPKTKTKNDRVQGQAFCIL